ncbi:MAG: SDR family oxidoreductase, partial [Pseudomonadota bacterium]|nr:SDR family oxidoreductase [Pseudomonadota bacterium]
PTRSEGVSEFIGKIAADRGLSAAQVEQEFIATERPSSLIKRLATVDEVANLAVYLASEQASATTGAAMRVDGGMVRSVV